MKTCYGCNQVEHEGQFRSCCTVVKGLQRSVFFVPAPGVFAGEELAALEAAAAADAGDAGARGELLRHLHVRTFVMSTQLSLSGPVGRLLAVLIVIRCRRLRTSHRCCGSIKRRKALFAGHMACNTSLYMPSWPLKDWP